MQTDDLIGKTLLVGLTFLDTDEAVIEQYQTFGTIVSVSAASIVIERSDSRLFSLPPDLDNLQPASAGEYRLKISGEVVVDPDFTSTWEITVTGDTDIERYKDAGFAVPTNA